MNNSRVSPLGWSYRKIEDIASKNKRSIKIGPFGSQLKKTELVESGIKVYGQENVMKYNFDIGDRYISDNKFRELKNFEIFPKDVLITMMGSIGHACIVPESISKGIMDSHLIRIQTNEDIIQSNFLSLLIKESFDIKKQIKLLSHGAIMSGLNSQIIRSIVIPIPPLVEQRGIAEVLGTVDEAIRHTNEVITKAEELKRGLIQRLLTRGIGHTDFRQTELGEIPIAWKIFSYQDVTERITYGFTNPMSHTNEGPYLITAKDIINDEIDYKNANRTTINEYKNAISDKSRPKIDDVLITKDGTLGRVAVVDKNLICVNQSVGVLKPQKEIILPHYLALTLITPYLQKKIVDEAGSTTIRHIQITKLAKWKLALPPKTEQDKILMIINQIREYNKYLLQMQLGNIKIKQGLMQTLLSGKNRVRLDEGGLHRIRDS